jgi:hypothetical protein
MGASISWAEAETDTQFTIFDSSVLKKQCLILQIQSGKRKENFKIALNVLKTAS